MEETIELRQIIEIILKGKYIIAAVVVFTTVLAFIMNEFVLDEQYESKATVQISSGVQDTGVMSNYIATEFTPLIYMQRIQNVEKNKEFFKEIEKEDFVHENVFVSNQTNTNLVELSYKGNSPETAQENLTLLMDKTKSEMDLSVKDTLNQLEETYLNESKILSEEIETLILDYNRIIISNKLPEMLLLQTISSEQFILNLSDNQTNSLAGINGALQNELLQLRAQIKTKATEYEKVLAKYQSVKTGMESFKPDPFIRVIIEPTLANGPTSPSKVLNLVMGLVLGAMLGIIAVFFRAYWRKPAEN